MNLPVHVLDRVIDNLMGEVPGESFVGKQRVGIESRSCFDVLADFGLKGLLLPIRNYAGTNLPASFQDTDNGSLVFPASPGNTALPFLDMHVAGFPADEGFIRFDFASQLVKRTGLHSGSDAMVKEPCSL